MKSSLFSPRPWIMWKYAWRKRSNRLIFSSFFGVFFLVSIGIPYGITNRISEFFDWTLFDPSLTIDDSIPTSHCSIWRTSPSMHIMSDPFLHQLKAKERQIIFSQRMFVATIPVFFIFLFAPVEVSIRTEVEEMMSSHPCSHSSTLLTNPTMLGRVCMLVTVYASFFVFLWSQCSSCCVRISLGAWILLHSPWQRNNTTCLMCLRDSLCPHCSLSLHQTCRWTMQRTNLMMPLNTFKQTSPRRVQAEWDTWSIQYLPWSSSMIQPSWSSQSFVVGSWSLPDGRDQPKQ